MRFNEGAELDTSQVEDLRSGGGGGLGGRVALGGGGIGIVGVIIYILISLLGGGGGGGSVPSGGFGGVQPGQQADNSKIAAECRTGADANTNQDCRVIAFINSVQAYWTDQFARSGRTYDKAVTNFFRGAVNTGCGSATADVGPFYCPADKEVYIDLGFFDELHNRFGVTGNEFVEAYVLAHEYGHHVQDLLGTSQRVDPRDTGPTSGSVRLELQADCYAGVWGFHAGKSNQLSAGDVDEALAAATAIGDDRLQRQSQGYVVPESFTHGTSAQRVRWFRRGLESGRPADCDTFSSSSL